jgi:hypothetical protein
MSLEFNRRNIWGSKETLEEKAPRPMGEDKSDHEKQD